MAIGTVTKFNQFEDVLGGDAARQWDDATAGNIMFYLVKGTATPVATNTTIGDIGTYGTDSITAGDGAPIAATTLDIDATTTAGTAFYDSDDADFGASVTISAKWLVAVQPVTVNTPLTSDKVLWFVDLDDTNGTAEVSSTASVFKIAPAVNGWIKST